ncbi:MAG: adenosylcobinamide-GDP ribazoletransferase [Pirellulaceae bacterium]
MKGLLATVRFLTILPVPGGYGAEQTDLARGVPYFPVVGMLLGALAALLAWAASLVAPPMVVSAAIVVLLLGFSGGLHLDGLCDTADGLLSARPRERALEIMKDSHVGSMGVMAVVCVLLMKFASLASLPPECLWPAAFLMPLAGRCAMVMHMALLPYVRSSGLGSVFYTNRRYLAAIESVVLLLAACWLMFDSGGWIVAGVSIAVVVCLAVYFRCRIGGATGDTFGAACEIVEIMPALTMALWTFPFAK